MESSTMEQCKTLPSAKSSEGSVVTIEKDVTETDTHFRLRKYVFESAVSAGVSPERAVVLASLFHNAYYLGCTYPEEALKESRRYWPQEALQNPLYELLED